MTVEEHEEDEEQSVPRALSTVDAVGFELPLALGPNCEVALTSGPVQLARLVSWLKDVRNVVQFELMPVGMRAEVEDWASATAARMGITAIDFMS